MAFVDHDLHIHSNLSSCAGPKGITQTKENILKYAERNGFRTICVTDHYWDEAMPSRIGMWKKENTAWIRSILPLPQTDSVRFLFGCECDMDMDNVIGVAPQNYDNFDLIIIPTNHLHLSGQTCRGDEDMKERAALWCSRLDHVLEQNLPFHKVGIAHLTDTGIMVGRGYLDVLQYISDEDYIRLFRYGMLRRIIDEMGADRVLFGSDFPTCNPAMFVGGVLLDPLITDGEKEKIFSGNAKKLLSC